jgi:translation initiation factor IF-2
MTSEAKIRIYELAREVGVPSKDLVDKAVTMGFSVKSHQSSLTIEEATAVKKSFGKTGMAAVPSKSASKPTKRRAKAADKPSPKPVAVRPVVRRRKVTDDSAAAATTTPPAEPAVKAAAPVVRRVAVATPAPPVVTPEPAVSARVETPAPVKAEVIPTPAPTPAPEPVAAAPTPAPVAASEEPVEQATSASKVQVVVAGPDTIDLPGHQRRAPAPVKKVEVAPEPVAAAADAADAADTAEPVSAKERFEAELMRARELASKRDEERLAAKAEKTVDATETTNPRPDGRPEVGSVIKLPTTRIKVVERPLANTRGAQERRSRFAKQPGRGRGRDIRRKGKPKGTGRQTQITVPAEHKRVVRIEETTTVADLGKNMGIKSQELLKKLWAMGMVGISLNASMDFETAQLLAAEFQYEVQNVAFKEDDVFASEVDEDTELVVRPPVVTVMGHVDHGKTSLLDYIRKAKVTTGESGGITQHIGAYRVDVGGDHGEIVFIDTPGHAAFSEMRARGAKATDIVVLICAADDGVMPQTVESVKLAQEAGVTIIVAVNKSDVPGANPERVRQQLADLSLIPEEWGGETIYVDCSAITGDGVDKLLEAISLNAELMELRANPNKVAQGIVIEARLDRSRGPITTVLVQEGTLRTGDIVVVGEYMGKVRAAVDHTGTSLEEAGPGTPVEILGIDGVPNAGEILNATKDEKMAKQVIESRRQQKRKKELANSGKVSLEKLMSNIKGGEKADVLKIVLKADVQGSVEALRKALIDLSTEKVSVDVISSGVGGITESDVKLAHGNAIIVGFHVRPAGKARKLAEQEGVEINIYDIIYDALDDVKAAMAGLLAPIHRQVEMGRMEVRETFTIPRRGVVAGCMVTKGLVARRSHLRVIRDSVQVYEGKVSSLRRFKDEASEVKEGFECGLMLDGFNELEIGDVIESYKIVEEKATL